MHQLPSSLVKEPLPSGVNPLNFWVDHLWTLSKLQRSTGAGNQDWFPGLNRTDASRLYFREGYQLLYSMNCSIIARISEVRLRSYEGMPRRFPLQATPCTSHICPCYPFSQSCLSQSWLQSGGWLQSLQIFNLKVLVRQVTVITEAGYVAITSLQ